jgi:transposase-like protein
MIKLDPKIIKHFKGYNNSAEMIMTCLYFKFRYSLSYRDIEELSGIRGLSIDHSNIQRWVEKFTPLLDKRFRSRKHNVNGSWRMDETYIKVKGKWCYLYRAVDKYGLTIDFCLRAKRDGVAAKAFFRKAIKQHGKPVKVNVDKSGANKCALDNINDNYPEGEKIEIRQNKYLNNMIEQDHRFIKRRTKPALGFKSFNGAKQTITGIEISHMIKKGQLKTSNQNNKSAFNQFMSLVA